jgi:plastocyanin
MRHPYRWILILVLAAVAPVALAGASGAKKSVSMKNMAFDPADVQIAVGDTVVWTNNDERDHNVVDSGGAFKSDNLKPGGAFSYQFNKAGKFSYGCTYHPRMKGTITVAEKQPATKPS